MKKLPQWEALAILVGTVVGAGFLGIPYVVVHVGFPLGMAMLVIIGCMMMLQFLIVAEISLRTRSRHQLGGYVAHYLGKRWRGIITTLIVLESVGALLAYMIGEGQVLSAIFGGSPLAYSIGFLVVAGALLFFDLILIEKVELLLTLIMSSVVIGIIFFSWPSVRTEHFVQVKPQGLLPAYGVMLFAFLGASAIPQMRLILGRQERVLPRLIVFGALVPMLIYALFTVAVLGVMGTSVTPIATVGLAERLGPMIALIGNLLAAVTMFTAFLGLSLALKETFWFDLKFKKNEAWFLTVVAPLLLSIFGPRNFIGTLLVVGAVFGGLQGIILIFTWWKAGLRGDRDPEFVIPHRGVLGWTLITVFTVGIFYTFVSR